MSEKKRVKTNLEGWINQIKRIRSLAVKDKPVDYQLFDLLDNSFSEAMWAMLLNRYSDDQMISELPTLIESEKKLREYTETLEALISARKFVGSKKRLIYHAVSCQNAKRIFPDNVIVFKSKEDAKNQGYIACGTCMYDGTTYLELEAGVRRRST